MPRSERQAQKLSPPWRVRGKTRQNTRDLSCGNCGTPIHSRHRKATNSRAIRRCPTEKNTPSAETAALPHGVPPEPAPKALGDRIDMPASSSRLHSLDRSNKVSHHPPL